MIYKISSFLIFFLIHYACFGQIDSLRVKFDFIFGTDRYFPNDNRGIYLPDLIQEKRVNNSELRHDFKTYTDIPQLHASIFTGLLSEISLDKGYNFHFNLLAEDRGQSFGSLALNKVTLFPRIYGTINDTIKLGNQKIATSIKAGDLIKYQHNHGLTVNNLDVQGITIRLSTDKLYFDYTLIADLSQHVGLNIEEFYSYKVGYQIPWLKSLIDVAVSYDQYAQFKDQQNNLTVNASIDYANSKLFMESAYNLGNRNTAALIGLEFENEIGRFYIKNYLSYRFYSRMFNDGFLESSVRYRDTSTPT